MYQLHKATTKEIPLIRQLASEIWEPTYGTILTKEQLVYMFEMMYSAKSLEEQMHKLGQDYFIVYQHEEPVGYFSIEKEDDHCYILQKIYVLPNRQGKGVGKYMIDAAITYIESINSEAFTLKLYVNRENNAVSFYTHLGFTLSGTRDYPIGNNYYMNDYIMTKYCEKKHNFA